MMLEFKEFPKIHRWSRGVVVTEKLDGTNAAIVVHGGQIIGTQSRTRLITLADDNYGFARWVQDNKDTLTQIIGVHDGHHFGEWWGQGIQRKYNVGRKVFSLFNVLRWRGLIDDLRAEAIGLRVVPKIWTGTMDDLDVPRLMDALKTSGSYAAPGFKDPEGIVIFHENSYGLFKKTFEKDAAGKGCEVPAP